MAALALIGALALGGSGGLERPGPDVEIWRLRDYPQGVGTRQETRQIFARGYVIGASSALGRGALDEAEGWALRALAIDGAAADAFYALGMARQLAGDGAGAAEFYQRYIPLADAAGGAVALHNLGLLFEGRGEWTQAEVAYGKAVVRAPWNFDLVRRLAEFYRRRGEDNLALKLYEARSFHDRVEWAEALGPLYERAGRADDAGAVYERALQTGRARPETYLRLAEIYGQRRQYAEVVATCRALLARDPDRAEAHRLLALVLRRAGQKDRAAEHARAYIALAPDGESAAELARWLQTRGD